MSILDQIQKDLKELRASHEHAKELEREIAALRSQQERVNHSVPLPRTGIDYAFPPYPPPGKLKSVGFSFVMRYLTGEGKYLSRTEALQLSHDGIDIVAIFEQGATNALGGFTAGQRDSEVALHALDALHPKGDPPIYFTCDFDAAGEGKTETVSEYIRGCVSKIGWARVGIYAGYDVVKHLHSENRCKFFWQTLAWSHGLWFPQAQVRQIQNGIHVFGADCDLDKAVAADFGQFRV